MRTEAFINIVSKNMMGQQVNGRTLPKPDLKLYEKMQKRQGSNSPSGRMSNTSKGSPSAMRILGEDEAQDAREFANSILLRSGSTGGGKTLFINTNRDQRNASPMENGSPFMASQDPTATVDYAQFKQTKTTNRIIANRSSAMKNSLSNSRLDREFSPERKRGSLQPANMR